MDSIASSDRANLIGGNMATTLVLVDTDETRRIRIDGDVPQDTPRIIVHLGQSEVHQAVKKAGYAKVFSVGSSTVVVGLGRHAMTQDTLNAMLESIGLGGNPSQASSQAGHASYHGERRV